MPASATPGSAAPVPAFTTAINATVTDVAVDSYTAQVFAAHSGAVSIVNEYSGEVVANVPLGGAASPLLDASDTCTGVGAGCATTVLLSHDRRRRKLRSSTSDSGRSSRPRRRSRHGKSLRDDGDQRNHRSRGQSRRSPWERPSPSVGPRPGSVPTPRPACSTWSMSRDRRSRW